jgi:hypothetical protein
MRTILIATLGILLAAVPACRLLTTLSEPAARQATSLKAPAGDCTLAMSNNVTCRMSSGACTRALEIMKDIKLRSTRASHDILADEFVQRVSRSAEPRQESCNSSDEQWALKSFAGEKKAPYDVAGIVVPNLQELKLLIWGGGMVAGFLGDGVGSACMSAIGAGISYAESKSWIKCR